MSVSSARYLGIYRLICYLIDDKSPDITITKSAAGAIMSASACRHARGAGRRPPWQRRQWVSGAVEVQEDAPRRPINSSAAWHNLTKYTYRREIHAAASWNSLGWQRREMINPLMHRVAKMVA